MKTATSIMLSEEIIAIHASLINVPLPEWFNHTWLCEYLTTTAIVPNSDKASTMNGDHLLLTYNTCILTAGWFDPQVTLQLTSTITVYFYGNVGMQQQALLQPTSMLLPNNIVDTELRILSNQSMPQGEVSTATNPTTQCTDVLTTTVEITSVINNISGQAKWKHRSVVVRVLSVYYNLTRDNARVMYATVFNNVATGAAAPVEQIITINGTWWLYQPYIYTTANGQKVLALLLSQDLALVTAGNATPLICDAIVGHMNYLRNLLNASGLYPQQPKLTTGNLETPRKIASDMYRSIAAGDYMFNTQHDEAELVKSSSKLGLNTYPYTNPDTRVTGVMYHMDVWWDAYNYGYGEWVN